MAERRVRSFFLSADEVLALLTRRWHAWRWGTVIVHHIDGVPLDAKVESVHYDPYRAGFLFRVSHPSYDVVPDGMYAPDCGLLPGTLETALTVDHREGVPYLPAYNALLAENERLRGIFSDMCEDEQRLKGALAQGFEEGYIKAISDVKLAAKLLKDRGLS